MLMAFLASSANASSCYSSTLCIWNIWKVGPPASPQDSPSSGPERHSSDCRPRTRLPWQPENSELASSSPGRFPYGAVCPREVFCTDCFSLFSKANTSLGLSEPVALSIPDWMLSLRQWRKRALSKRDEHTLAHDISPLNQQQFSSPAVYLEPPGDGSFRQYLSGPGRGNWKLRTRSRPSEFVFESLQNQHLVRSSKDDI